MDDADLEECFRQLSTDARELYMSEHVPVLSQPPTPLEFHRDWVAPNLPVVIEGATDHWPARHSWTHDYLREKIGTKEVTVAVTPNGYADAVFKDKFVMPEERVMTFDLFLDIIKGKAKTAGVFYVQKQNSNFTDEFSELMSDADCEISWASQAFGKKPDAVNFWMGESKAVTSMHKDHYENLYSVIEGQKTFTLLPPTDQPHIPYEKYQAAVYKVHDDGEFDVVDDQATGMVPWIPLDPLAPDLCRFPGYRLCHPVTVTVAAGQTLYLPSLWYHHVQQSHGCIAVNFWYDMQFDVKYNYFTFVEKLLKQRKLKS